MRAMALDVSLGNKTASVSRAQSPQDKSAGQVFAHALKSDLGDSNHGKVDTSDGDKIAKLLISFESPTEGAASESTVAIQKPATQGKDVAKGPDANGALPKGEEIGETSQVVHADVRPTVVLAAKSNERTTKVIADFHEVAPTAASKDASIVKVKKDDARKSIKRESADEPAAAVTVGMEGVAFSGDKGLLQCGEREIETQQIVACTFDAGGKSIDNVQSALGLKSKGGVQGTSQVSGSGAREISGVEREKNRSKKPTEGRVAAADLKDSSAKAGVEMKDVKPVAMAAGAELKGSSTGSPAGVEKMEAGSGSGMITLQHGTAGLIGPDITGGSHRSGVVTEPKQAMDQVVRLETTSSLHTQSLSHRDEYGRAGDSAPILLGATPTALEVGMVSGTHGWLKIRAEMENGVVTASLSAKSTAAQEMLHHELPSLTAFLQEEKIGGSSVVVRQTSAMSTGDMSQQSEMQRQGRQTQQGSDTRSDDAQTGSNESTWGWSERITMHEAWRGLGSDVSFLSAMAGGNGGWLNVRA